MAKRSNSEQLNDALEAMMTDPTRPLPAPDAKFAALLRIAGDLRDLPSGDFKARLKADLLAAVRRNEATSAVPAYYGKVLMTVDDYIERIDELAKGVPLLPYDLDTALRELPDRGSRFLTVLNDCAIGVSRFSGQPHWEWHDGDEMLLASTPEMTVYHIALSPRIHYPPHDHRMAAMIGLYRGSETSFSYRRSGRALVASGRHDYAAPCVGELPADAIHSVVNLGDAPSAAIHVYFGDLTGIARSIWDADLREERPFDNRFYFEQARLL